MKNWWIAFVYKMFIKFWFPRLRDTRVLAIHLAEIETYRQTHGFYNGRGEIDTEQRFE